MGFHLKMHFIVKRILQEHYVFACCWKILAQNFSVQNDNLEYMIN